MKRSPILFLPLAVIALLLINFTPQTSSAVWQTALDEHFEEDQRNPQLEWPWRTGVQRGRRLRWHWNPRPPHPRTGPSYTDYCWGLQNHIYNRAVLRDEDQALWCAYTNRNDVERPRWPADDDYMNNQNAWVWWGPLDLTDAVAAEVSFWTLVDLDHVAGDSLSVVVTNDANDITLNDDPFREDCPIGFTLSRGIQDWTEYNFSLDELILDGEEYSIFDEEDVDSVYFCWVWHSNGQDIAGMGAFLDDVTIRWDDGLFDLFPVAQKYGYSYEDDVVWTSDEPRYGDEVFLQFEWDVEGDGETPEFTIECYIDDELFYSEDRVGSGAHDTTFFSVTDEAWAVPAGDHVISWRLDTPLDEDGVVEETLENNNELVVEFTAVWNPPPMFTLTSPAEDTLVPVNLDLTLSYTIADSNDGEEFSIYYYVSDNLDGLEENPELIFDYLMIGQQHDVQPGEGEFIWDVNQYYRQEFVFIGDNFHVVAFATDSDPGNMTIAVADGMIELVEPVSINGNEDAGLPSDLQINSAYPNPFNGRLNIDYSTPIAGQVYLNVYDLSGRLITSLVNGVKPAGNHAVSWSPISQSAGIYMMELSAGGERTIQKVLYLP